VLAVNCVGHLSVLRRSSIAAMRSATAAVWVDGREAVDQCISWVGLCFISVWIVSLLDIGYRQNNIQKWSSSTGEMYSTKCRSGRWTFWSWFDVNPLLTKICAKNDY